MNRKKNVKCRARTLVCLLGQDQCTGLFVFHSRSSLIKQNKKRLLLFFFISKSLLVKYLIGLIRTFCRLIERFEAVKHTSKVNVFYVYHLSHRNWFHNRCYMFCMRELHHSTRVNKWSQSNEKCDQNWVESELENIDQLKFIE